jgi:hypothetical protein
MLLLLLCAATAAWAMLGGLGAQDGSATVEAVEAVDRPRGGRAGPPSLADAAVTTTGAGLAAAPGAPAPDAPMRGAAEPLARAGGPASGIPLRTSLRASEDLFPVPPAPRVASPAPPPPPPPVVAPKPRFGLIGRLVDGATPTAVLRDGDRVVTLRTGQHEAGYRLVAVDEVGAAFVHEATGQTVRIGFGEPRPGGELPRVARAGRAGEPRDE